MADYPLDNHRVDQWEIRKGSFDEFVLWQGWRHPATGEIIFCRMVFSGTQEECEKRLAEEEQRAQERGR